MESLALSYSSSLVPLLAGARHQPPPPPSVPSAAARRGGGARRVRFLVSAKSGDGFLATWKSKIALERLNSPGFATISSQSSNNNIETMRTSTSTMPLVPPPSPSIIGSPVFLVGVGIAIAAVFSMVTSQIRQYAMQQAFKTMINQAAPTNGQFNNSAFPGGIPFPFPPPQEAPTMPSSFSSSSHTISPAVTVDVPSESDKVKAVETSEVFEELETIKPPKKYAFVDVSQGELLQKERETLQEIEKAKSESTGSFEEKVNEDTSYKKAQAPKSEPKLTVDTLEKMMEDPTVQKMVFPHFPEEMRNPETFKWMLQNPQYRQQLQDMLNNMRESPEWDSRMVESFENLDLNSPEIKQQFEQIGMTPEEVASKIMANPEVAMAFYNPKIQAAIMDLQQNPYNIAKYQNDKEVMDAFAKISELFPGVSG